MADKISVSSWQCVVIAYEKNCRLCRNATKNKKISLVPAEKRIIDHEQEQKQKKTGMKKINDDL
jgi:uncharacterized membrane protein